MKTIVIVAILVALCSGHVIPGDKSDNEKGESLDMRSGAYNQYSLYTRRNPSFPQTIVHGNVNSVLGSMFNANLPLNVIVHGWSGEDLSAPVNSRIINALLVDQDCNVIVVDWYQLASADYVTAAAGVPSVGEDLGNFLTWFINVAGGNWDRVHLIGFGMGAHVIGNAGRQTGGRPARITGLNPAGKLWYSNPNRLSLNDGQYVEVIHTDVYGLGILVPSGDADFYINRGQRQPGCITAICNHNRATELFIETLGRFHTIDGKECIDLVQALQGNCNGAEFPMGNGNVDKRGSGIYSLRVGISGPL